MTGRFEAGETRKATVIYTSPGGERLAAEVYRAVNADTHGELAERALKDGPEGLNWLVADQMAETVALAVPFVFHSPKREILVLVLPESFRCRELEERAAFLLELAKSTVPPPEYAVEFVTAFGPGGLRSALGAGRVKTVQDEGADLVSLLQDPEHRKEAALELCRRGGVEALESVFSVVEEMNRHDACEVFATTQVFGPEAEPYWLQSLKSPKAFIRQGGALALAGSGSEAATAALCDLLFREPTEVWTEVARAVGRLGPEAIPSVVQGVHGSGGGEDPAAWALAYIANRGGSRQLESLVRGRDSVAARIAHEAQSKAAVARANEEKLESSATTGLALNALFSKLFWQSFQGQEWQRVDSRDLLSASDIDAGDQAQHLDESDFLPG